MSNDEPRAEPGAASSPAAAPERVEQLIRQAEQAGASDIHLQMRGATAEVGFRLDGVITRSATLPEGIAERVFGRIKYLARLKTYQDSLPQDGRINKQDVKSASDIRVATYPTVTGEKIVLRLFQTAAVRTLSQLEFPPDVRDQLEGFLSQTSGLLLLTGPAGSGKTTTIYACLQALAAGGDRHIITVEDPVEQVVPGIMQTEVNEPGGLSFAVAARHLLRQDPQALVIGEIRDEETAGLVVRASLTGHLVISTLHAGSCAGVLARLTVLCRDYSAVGSSLRLALNQRLVRRFCAHCRGSGCALCLQTGFRGRLPMAEFLTVTSDIRGRLEARDLAGIRARVSLRERARELVRAGLTSEPEIFRVLGGETERE
jgi:type II secretory ATPase GspE/PulE/Tfp pilus assembly ATPase PilB-like protein